MLATLVEELGTRGASVLFGLMVGGTAGWAIGRWRRFRARQSIMRGDARDTVVIHHHLLQRGDGAGSRSILRIRSLGQGELSRVVPNGHLARELHRRALQVTPRDTLISMAGPEGSYLLETLTNFVCDRVANAGFEHDLYVMAPCCEPAALATHQPISILLIAAADLPLFENWPACRDIQVEHGSDGARILTLMELARRFRAEQATIASLRQAGKRTQFVETMYVLDLTLDKRTALVPVKDVAWSRFAQVLKQMNLEA